jgi:uncharacterized protein (DUF302 family)
MSYGFSKESNLDFEELVIRVREELKKEGFGILTEIDVKKTLKEKLDVDWDDYIILGACNPQFAHKALKAEREIGLLLPCNVVVYSKDGKNFVSVINPRDAMSVVDNEELKGIAGEVGGKLRMVLEGVK